MKGFEGVSSCFLGIDKKCQKGVRYEKETSNCKTKARIVEKHSNLEPS